MATHICLYTYIHIHIYMYIHIFVCVCIYVLPKYKRNSRKNKYYLRLEIFTAKELSSMML